MLILAPLQKPPTLRLYYHSQLNRHNSKLFFNKETRNLSFGKLYIFRNCNIHLSNNELNSICKRARLTSVIAVLGIKYESQKVLLRSLNSPLVTAATLPSVRNFSALIPNKYLLYWYLLVNK